jgi:hypothetical protein
MIEYIVQACSDYDLFFSCKVFLIILGISSRSSGISSYLKVAQLLLQRHSIRIADWCLRFQTFRIFKESTENQEALIAVFWSTRSLVEMVEKLEDHSA